MRVPSGIPGNILVVTAFLLMLSGCRDKTPYPPVAPEPGKVMQVAAESPEPVLPPAQPPRAMAFVRTARGTVIVAGHDSGQGLVVSQIPGHAWVAEDGSVRVIKVKSRAPDVNTPRKRSSLAGLVMEEYSPGRGLTRTVDLTPDRTASWNETSAAIKQAVEADPDHAGDFFHIEKIVSVGSSGALSAWLVTVESRLGDAPRPSTVELLAVDSASGAVVDLSDDLAGRDVAREILGDRYDAACVRDVCGIARMEAGGGIAVPVVLLCAAFESCAGQYSFEPVPTDARPADASAPVLEAQTFVIPGVGPVEKGVVDFRVSASRDMAVVEMALGALDELTLPWSQTKGRVERSKTREVRFWVPGMSQAAVIGRFPEIQSVQFIPAGGAAVDALAAVRGISN